MSLVFATLYLLLLLQCNLNWVHYDESNSNAVANSVDAAV